MKIYTLPNSWLQAWIVGQASEVGGSLHWRNDGRSNQPAFPGGREKVDAIG
jgi:hypothetical protein